MEERTASEQIDDIIRRSNDWRGDMLAKLRALITAADPAITEEVKWKKPSKPEGVSVWAYEGNICMADILKNAVRLTFPKGVHIPDPKHLFNTRLDSQSVRAIDFYDGETIDGPALQAIIRGGAKLNSSKAK